MILPEKSDPPNYYRLPVPLGERAWLTENRRYGWRAKAKIVAQWRGIASLYAFSLPKMAGAHIIAELRFCDARRRDPLNWAPTAKAIIDGLVDAAIFPDDDHTRIIGPDLRCGPKVPKAEQAMILHIWPSR